MTAHKKWKQDKAHMLSLVQAGFEPQVRYSRPAGEAKLPMVLGLIAVLAWVLRLNPKQDLVLFPEDRTGAVHAMGRIEYPIVFDMGEDLESTLNNALEAVHEHKLNPPDKKNPLQLARIEKKFKETLERVKIRREAWETN